MDFLQWPAMVVTVLAAWLVGSSSAHRRKAGFWVFLGSNVLWVCWGIAANAQALIVLQFALAAMNTRGMIKNMSEERAKARERRKIMVPTLPLRT